MTLEGRRDLERRYNVNVNAWTAMTVLYCLEEERCVTRKHESAVTND